jgi:predicted nucleic acid-binding protein
MGLKQRTEQLTQEQAQNAWLQFERVCANDLQLLTIETRTFHKAAQLTLDATTGLRAGDALHLACALDAKASGIVTLDKVMANNAKRLKLKHVVI